MLQYFMYRIFNQASTCQGCVSGTYERLEYPPRLGLTAIGQGRKAAAEDLAPAPILFSLEEKDFARLPNFPLSSLRLQRTDPRPGDLEEIQELFMV